VEDKMQHQPITATLKQLGTHELPLKQDDPPFQESLRTLLGVVQAEAGATGYACYEYVEPSGTLRPRLVHGLAPRQPHLHPVTIAGRPLHIANTVEGAPAILSFPLLEAGKLTGVLDFGFANPPLLTGDQHALIGRTVEVAGRLLKASTEKLELVRTVARIVELECALADQKITERARGLSAQPHVAGRSALLHDHITRVLDAPQLAHRLSAYAEETQNRVQARRLVTQAKHLLQRTSGLSEEEAYLVLREQSRRTRTPLPVIAQDLIDGRAFIPGLHRQMTA